MNEYIESWKRAFDFSGRSRRREYWMPILVNFCIGFVLGILMALFPKGNTLLNGVKLLYELAYFIPGLALSVRRLHDIGRSGWWYLITLIPFVGIIIFIVFLCRDSDVEANKYGDSPKYQ